MKVVANQAANVDMANDKHLNMQKNSMQALQSDHILNARKIEVEGKLQEWEREKANEKKVQIKKQLEDMLRQREIEKNRGKNPLTTETLKQLKLDRSEIQKLILQ